MFNYYVSYFLVKDVPITEESRVIPPNTLFSILGSTQLSNVAKIIARMDHGHGLVDRFLIATPLAYRPTLTEMEMASDHLSTEVVENFEECFKNIYEQHTVHFSFSKAAQQLLRENIDQFVGEVNEAIREGKVPPKSKVPELIPRVATALHVFNHTMEGLLAGVPASPPPQSDLQIYTGECDGIYPAPGVSEKHPL